LRTSAWKLCVPTRFVIAACERAGHRVMASVVRFIERRLRLNFPAEGFEFQTLPGTYFDLRIRREKGDCHGSLCDAEPRAARARGRSIGAADDRAAGKPVPGPLRERGASRNGGRRRAGHVFLTPRHRQTPPFGATLHLREPPIDEQFRSRDVAAVVRREEHYGLGDFVWRAESPKREAVRKHLRALLAGLG
jgi:hypothetical protein